MVFIVALGIVPKKPVVNNIVLVKKNRTGFHDYQVYTTHVVVYVQILLKLPIVFSEIRPPKPKKIKSKSCTFSVRRSVSAHM